MYPTEGDSLAIKVKESLRTHLGPRSFILNDSDRLEMLFHFRVCGFNIDRIIVQLIKMLILMDYLVCNVQLCVFHILNKLHGLYY